MLRKLELLLTSLSYIFDDCRTLCTHLCSRWLSIISLFECSRSENDCLTRRLYVEWKSQSVSSAAVAVAVAAAAVDDDDAP